LKSWFTKSAGEDQTLGRIGPLVGNEDPFRTQKLHVPPQVQVGQEASFGSASMNTSTPPSGSAATTTPSPASPSTEDKLFEAMDRAALKWIEMLDNDELGEDGELKIPIELRFKLFEKGQDWLVRRKKLKPVDDSEGEGITDMRAWINNPAMQEMLDQMMFDRGYVKLPPRKKGRPTAAESLVRDRFKTFNDESKAAKGHNDDSGFKKLLEEPETEGEEV
jgi:hypothetical protein